MLMLLSPVVAVAAVCLICDYSCAWSCSCWFLLVSSCCACCCRVVDLLFPVTSSLVCVDPEFLDGATVVDHAQRMSFMFLFPPCFCFFLLLMSLKSSCFLGRAYGVHVHTYIHMRVYLCVCRRADPPLHHLTKPDLP